MPIVTNHGTLLDKVSSDKSCSKFVITCKLFVIRAMEYVYDCCTISRYFECLGVRA